MPPQSEPPCAKADPPGTGLHRRDWNRIAVVIVGALTCAGLLLFLVPTLLVHREYYVDPRAYTDALNASRIPLGVFSTAILAGAAALIGVIMSNHNARLTRESNAIARASSESTRESLRETLESTERRDEKTRAHDRIKADDDQFAKAVEMLGSPAVEVRAGALHILYRLAISAPERTQPVVDVFCSYLRQPFHHPDLDHDPTSAELPAVPERAWWPQDAAERDARDGEHDVRRTAWRLIDALLPGTGSGHEAPAGLHLDLTAAVLDELTLKDKVVTTLRLERAYLAGNLLLTGTHVTGNVLLGGVHIAGRVHVGGGTRIAQDVRVEAGAHVTGSISVGDPPWPFSPPSREGAEIDSLKIENAHVGQVSITTGVKIHNVVTIWGKHVENDVRVKEAVIDYNFTLGTGTTVGRSVRVDNATIDGSLKLQGTDLQIAGEVRVDRAKINSLYIGAQSIGGGVKVSTETPGYVSLNVDKIEGDVTIFIESHKPGHLFMYETTVTGTLVVANLSKHRRNAQIWAIRVYGGLKIRSLQLDQIEDVIWSGQGEKDLPANVQALPREGGDYTLQLLRSGQAETAAGS